MSVSAMNAVPVAPLREAFLGSGKTAAEVAHALGWTTPKVKRGRKRYVADGYRVGRALGIRPEMSKGRNLLRVHCHYDLALRLADAIGVDPVDVGL